jgi:hypothetical protein
MHENSSRPQLPQPPPERSQRSRKRKRRSSSASSSASSSSSSDEIGLSFDPLRMFKIDHVFSDHGQYRTPEAEAEWKNWMRFRPQINGHIRDPRDWWIKEIQENPRRFPILGRMALDLFSCPAMSAECERVFSSAKRTITVDRNNLSSKMIRANELQKHWLKNKLVDSMLFKFEKQEGRQL